MINTKLLRSLASKGWADSCLLEKKAILRIADELDELRGSRKPPREVVQYQVRLRDPLLPECNVWMNITEAGATTIREKHLDVYEIRELVERDAAEVATAPDDSATKIAKHLREQAKLFRQEDPLGRGAKELEQAANLLESRGATCAARVLKELHDWMELLKNLYEGDESWSVAWRMACKRTQEHIESIVLEPITHAKVAAAATQACASRTGADGWIFENTEQLLQFMRAAENGR